MVDITKEVKEATKEHLENNKSIVVEAVVEATTKHIPPKDTINELIIKTISETTKSLAPTKLEVTYNGTTIKVDTPHFMFEKLLNIAKTQLPIMLTGEAGSGKSQAVIEVARIFNTTYNAISVGEQTTKSDILGFIDANGTYRTTAFRQAFENGGIFLLDEVDAGNPNVLLAINTGLSNGFVEFPDKKIYKHDSFQLIATANTYGKGSNTTYVGRNKLDGATLNRFVVLEWKRDDTLEAILCNNTLWTSTIKEARKLAEDIEGHLITMRTALYGAKLLDAGLSIDDVFDTCVTVGLDRYGRDTINKAKVLYSDPITVGTEVYIPDSGKFCTIRQITADGSYILVDGTEVLHRDVVVMRDK